LNGRSIGTNTHQTAQRVYLPDHRALRHTTYRRVAAQLRHPRQVRCDQQRSPAHATGRSRRLAAGVAAANDYDIVFFDHPLPELTSITCRLLAAR
jgi:hypothetical protein